MTNSGPIEHQTLAERTYQRLRHEMESGALPQGSRLDERALCERLGVSRTPLRHAIERLVHDGLVQRAPYKGTFVRSLRPAEVENLYIVRSTLEQLAVRLAVERASDDDVAKIRQIALQCQSAVARGDANGLSAADQLFHSAIVEASQNDVLIRLLAGLRRQVHAVRTYANEDAGLAKRTVDERVMICEALEARNAELAAALLGAHIDGVRESVRAVLRGTTSTQAEPAP
jgi:DNA-binding GntR family transcriptional regulator